jgi:SNF family Na+-dependent transporter
LHQTDRYFFEHILGIDKTGQETNGVLGGFNYYLLGVYLLSWAVVYFCVRGNVNFIGKLTFFTIGLPIALMLVLFGRVLLLDGGPAGICKMLFHVDVWKIFEVKVWFEAALQSFFQYGAGWGAVQTLASFRKRHTPLGPFVRWIPVVNCIVGILSACIIFGALGHFSKSQNLEFNELELSINGPELIFVSYPGVFMTMKHPMIISGLFFSAMVLLGLSSLLGIVEIISNFLRSRKLKFRDEELGQNGSTLVTCLALGTGG